MSGLRLFDIALIIGAAGGIVLAIIQGLTTSFFKGMSSGDFSGLASASAGSMGISVLSSALAIAELVLIIIGLGRMADISGYFRKARNYYIGIFAAAVCIFIVAMIMAFVVIAQALANALTAMQVTIDVMIAVFMAAETALTVMMYNNIFYGCQEISAATGDFRTFEKMAGFRKFYMITLIGSAALNCIGLIIMISEIFGAVDSAMMSQMQSGQEILSSILAGSAGMIGAVIFFAAGWLWREVVDIILIVRLWKFIEDKEGRTAAAVVTPTDVTLMAPVEEGRVD